jgi:hypothetical protein
MTRLSFVMSWAWEYLKPLVERLLSAHGRELAAASIEAVRILEAEDAPGIEKLRMATEMIRGHLKRIGIEFATSEIQAAVHAALLRVRSQ